MKRERIAKRIEALESRNASGHNAFVLKNETEGTVSACGGGELDPMTVATAQRVFVVCFPPWDSVLRRDLTDDELETKHPGRRERLEALKQIYPRVFENEGSRE